MVFSGQLNGALVVLYRQSELHKNCSSVIELATIASSSGDSGSQLPSLPSFHTDMDCSWKPFGLYLLDSWLLSMLGGDFDEWQTHLDITESTWYLCNTVPIAPSSMSDSNINYTLKNIIKWVCKARSCFYSLFSVALITEGRGSIETYKHSWL